MPEPMIRAAAISIGLTLIEPSVNDVVTTLRATAARKTTMPRSAGPAIARRVSSSLQATGRRTVYSTLARVRPTITKTKM